MFFPRLTRRNKEYYYNSNGVFFSDYTRNHEKISIDCQHRCVYCDVSLSEIGGEGMQLDHFRPQNHFSSLKSHPYNLYLACPKCNRLKSDDWPCEKIIDRPSFIGSVGYVDPFECDIKEYLDVDSAGFIVQKSGPINYMIGRMLLNRLSRTQIRRKRIVDNKKREISKLITELIERVYFDLAGEKECSTFEVRERLRSIISLKNEFDSL